MAVAFDAVSNAAGAAQTNATLGLTFAHTCGASATLLIVEASFSDSEGSVTTMAATYNGVAMTAVPGSIVHANGSTYGFTQVFYMTSPPTGSAHNVVITAAGAASYNRILGAALSYTGADAPTGVVTASGTGTSIGRTVTVAAGELGVQFASAELAIATSESHTERWALNNSNFSGNANAKHQETTTPGSPVSFTLTCTSGPWATVGYVIPAASGGDATFTASAGDAPAAGASASFTGAATFTASVGDAPSAGASATLTGAATFAASAGDAPAAGAAASFTASATFTTSAGDASSDGAAASFTGAASFAANAGDATGDGGTASLIGAATGTFTALVGDAAASGSTASFTLPAPETVTPARILAATARTTRVTATARTTAIDAQARTIHITANAR